MPHEHNPKTRQNHHAEQVGRERCSCQRCDKPTGCKNCASSAHEQSDRICRVHAFEEQVRNTPNHAPRAHQRQRKQPEHPRRCCEAAPPFEVKRKGEAMTDDSTYAGDGDTGIPSSPYPLREHHRADPLEDVCRQDDDAGEQGAGHLVAVQCADIAASFPADITV